MMLRSVVDTDRACVIVAVLTQQNPYDVVSDPNCNVNHVFVDLWLFRLSMLSCTETARAIRRGYRAIIRPIPLQWSTDVLDRRASFWYVR